MARAVRGAAAAASAAAAPAASWTSRSGARSRARRLTTLRKTISNKMVESWTHVPHVTQFDEADVTAIMALRKKYAAGV